MRSQANDNQFKQELAKVVGTELWDAAKAASTEELKVRSMSLQHGESTIISCRWVDA